MIVQLKELVKEFPEIPLEELDRVFFEGFFGYGLLLGLNPFKLPGVGSWEKRWGQAIKKIEAEKSKIRVHYACVSLSEGKPSDYVSSFRTAGSPHVLAKVKAWHEESERLAQANAAKNGGNQTYAG